MFTILPLFCYYYCTSGGSKLMNEREYGSKMDELGIH